MAFNYETDFTATDNGDGTFTLTPTGPASAAELIKEYRRLRQKVLVLTDHRDQVIAQIQDARDRRDEIKTLLETAGETPDDDL